MALPALTKRLVEKTLSEYCEVPAHIRDKLLIGYKIRGNSVTLFEGRPVYFDKSKWTQSVVAQFRYSPIDQKWTLYCADRNSRWHKYSRTKPSKIFELLLNEVEADPTGIFWG
jgi:hypothetical protein